jgi:hypothetical protein
MISDLPAENVARGQIITTAVYFQPESVSTYVMSATAGSAPRDLHLPVGDAAESFPSVMIVLSSPSSRPASASAAT